MASTGIGHPANLVEFEKRFRSESACLQYLAHIRWPCGFQCERCRGTRGWALVKRGLWECRDCHHQTSVTAGTLFEGTRKPLNLWFRAMWFIASQKNGVSALALQRQLGLKRYETVWTWLQKLRRAMVRPNRDRLSGIVEVDETYVGGEEIGVRGRKTHKKALVLVAAEEQGKRIGRIRLERVKDASASTLLPFIERVVVPGSVIHTDGWDAYAGVSQKGYRHQVTKIQGSGQEAHELLPRVHRVASLLKRWLLGTHQGAVRKKHLEYYLDEFTFRFNRRSSRERGKLFRRLIEQALQYDPLTWTEVAAGKAATTRSAGSEPERTG